MKAVIFKREGEVVIENRPKPVVKQDTDAVVRVVLSCVCGSDLWYYRGISQHKEGGIGHEFIGVVEAVGDAVHDVKTGDFVIAPFAYSDGTCPNCIAGVQTACQHGGYFGGGNEDDGGQAEFVRVPHADGTLVVVPGETFSDDTMASLLTLSDIMGTGYHAAVSADVKAGDTVVVVGDGAVGLAGIISAKLLGATRIIAMSRHEDRQALAKEFGATDIVAERGEEGVKAVMKLTDDVGADAVLECVGSNEAMQTACKVARAGSIVGRVGVPHDVEIDANSTFARNIGIRGGPAPVRAYMDELLPAVLEGRINPGRVFNLKTDLEDIAEAYAAMDERRAIKSLLRVSNI
jgi:alcohol dehydrogenase